MPLKYTQYTTQSEQLYGVAQSVKNLIDQGVAPSDIAIISRKHKSLEALLPFIQDARLNYYYEKDSGVFDNYYIAQLITLARYCNDFGGKSQGQSDHLLPEILAFPFWGITTLSLWEIAQEASKAHISWFEVIHDPENTITNAHDKVTAYEIAIFLAEVSRRARLERAEIILDILVGLEECAGITSQFKLYYFDLPLEKSINTESEEAQGSYLTLLSSLRTLVQAVRDHRKQNEFKLKDFVEFVNLVENHDISIIDRQIFNTKSDAINLLSAHKSKGLEFKYVFVINVNKAEWETKGRAQLLSFPSNLPIQAVKDDQDDAVRLFFVAITRAEHVLSLSTFIRTDDDKAVEGVSFVDVEWDEVLYDSTTKEHILALSSGLHKSIPFGTSESHKRFLASVVENYTLSVTHLLAFLNVIKGGPRGFVQTGLLRFPQAKSKHASYGTAVHNALRAFYVEFSRTQQLPSVDYLIAQFESYLKNESLSQADYCDRLYVGQKNLINYYQKRSEHLVPTSIIERDFKYYNVYVGEAHITGKLDKMDIYDDTIVVSDFKTGKAFDSWKQSPSSHEAINAWKYSTQLVFYKLLVENSSAFGGRYTVERGIIEFVSDSRTDQGIVLLEKQIEDDETDTLQKLVEIVYTHIIALNFPDTSHYSQDIKGINQFIQDLLDGTL